jgi:hypothetical protein
MYVTNRTYAYTHAHIQAYMHRKRTDAWLRTSRKYVCTYIHTYVDTQ